MKEKELAQREKLIDRIEGYYGTMNNIHKLSTDELIIIKSSIDSLEHFKNQCLINFRNLKK